MRSGDVSHFSQLCVRTYVCVRDVLTSVPNVSLHVFLACSDVFLMCPLRVPNVSSYHLEMSAISVNFATKERVRATGSGRADGPACCKVLQCVW